MTNAINLPYVADVVAYLVDARFDDSIQVVNTAAHIHDCLLVPCPLSPDSPLFAYYPPLRATAHARPLTIAPEIHAYIAQLPRSGASTIFAEDVLFAERARLIEAYRQALMQRAKEMTEDATRIDAPFPPMTPAEYQGRVTYVMERAITIPIPQTTNWWADVTCGVALSSPSDAALAKLAAAHPDSPSSYRRINSRRQIGIIIELLER